MSDLTERARELLNDRMEVLDRLGAAQEDVTKLTTQLREAHETMASAWSDATTSGWLPRELRTLGLTQPVSKRGGRPAKPKTPRLNKTDPARPKHVDQVRGQRCAET